MRQTCEHMKTSNNLPCFAVRPGEAADGPIDSDLVWARLLSSNDAGQVNSSQFLVFFYTLSTSSLHEFANFSDQFSLQKDELFFVYYAYSASLLDGIWMLFIYFSVPHNHSQNSEKGSCPTSINI